MKRKIAALLLIITISAFTLASCRFLFSLGEKTVVYDFGEAGDDIELKVDGRSKAPRLAAPEYEGYKFVGWYTDRSYTETYDFEAPVVKDIKLYARFVEIAEGEGEPVDFEELVNAITLETMRATVMLAVEKYDVVNTIWGEAKSNVSHSSGSGVIYAEEGEYYYCLTNNHVIATEKSGITVTVLDYKSVGYAAEIVAADAKYDLAVVRFLKNASAPLEVLPFNTTPPAVGETVIAIGTPDGQPNAVTVGEVIRYATASIGGVSDTQSDISFPVIWHSAPMDNGSSGGVLIDTELRIVGINYAAASSNGEFVYGLSVPVEKVLEFLEMNNIEF